ncbi:MAG: Ger(x)C family spore germination C-terminal domain-containing protein, partial [Niameybacter sp.]
SDENKKLIEKQVMDEIETKLANEIIAQVNVGIDKSKEMNIDFLGLGNECYRHEPDIWAKYKQDWFKDAYKNMSISIGVDVDVQSTGLEE